MAAVKPYMDVLAGVFWKSLPACLRLPHTKAHRHQRL